MNERTKSLIWTIAGVFFVSAAVTFLNAGGDLWNMSTAGWHAIVNNAIAAVLTFAIALVAPPAAKKLGLRK